MNPPTFLPVIQTVSLPLGLQGTHSVYRFSNVLTLFWDSKYLYLQEGEPCMTTQAKTETYKCWKVEYFKILYHWKLTM